MSQCERRIEADRLLEKFAGMPVVTFSIAAEQFDATKQAIISRHAGRAATCNAFRSRLLRADQSAWRQLFASPHLEPRTDPSIFRSNRSLHNWWPCSRIDQLRGNAHLTSHLRTLPSTTYRTPRSRPICFMSTDRPLKAKLELRAMTKQRPETRQICNDVLRDSVSEVFLFDVTTHVCEWQNGYGWLVGQR